MLTPRFALVLGAVLAFCTLSACGEDAATEPDLAVVATPDLSVTPVADLSQASADAAMAPDLGPPAAVGSYIWAKGFGATGGGSNYDSGYFVDVAPDGTTLLSGSWNGTSITFGSTPALTAAAGDHRFLLSSTRAGPWSGR